MFSKVINETARYLEVKHSNEEGSDPSHETADIDLGRPIFQQWSRDGVGHHTCLTFNGMSSQEVGGSIPPGIIFLPFSFFLPLLAAHLAREYLLSLYSIDHNITHLQELNTVIGSSRLHKIICISNQIPDIYCSPNSLIYWQRALTESTVTAL